MTKSRRLTEVDGQVAIITGAVGGIGRATALRLADAGVSIVAVDLVADALESLASELRARGAAAVTLAGDVTDDSIAPAAVKLARDTFSRLDILVNNAGMGSEQVPTWQIDPAVWRRDLDVNLTSQFVMARAAVPVMIEAGYGRIINVASAAGMEGHAMAGGYAAAKAGVVAMTKTMGKELAKTGVIVNAIAPALINSRMLNEPWFTDDVRDSLLSRIPMGRIGEPEEVAELIAYLASSAVTFTTGHVFDLSGGRATY
jgi:NAD(P)-dependent dehydrogenase (short-subunit alcohol dehydrogenase family)